MVWESKEISFLRMKVSRNKEYGKQNKYCGISKCSDTAVCSAAPNTCSVFGCLDMCTITLPFLPHGQALIKVLQQNQSLTWPPSPHPNCPGGFSVCHREFPDHWILPNQVCQISRLSTQTHRPHLCKFRGLGVKAGFAAVGQVPRKSWTCRTFCSIGGTQRTSQQHRLECADAPS